MKEATFNGYPVRLVETEDEIEVIKSHINPKVRVGIDTETMGLTYKEGQIVGLCVSCGETYSTKDYAGYYLPVRHTIGHNLDISKVFEFAQYLIDNTVTIFWNRNFDVSMMEYEGVKIPCIGHMNDAQVMAYLATNESYPALKAFCTRYLGWQMIEFSENEAENGNFGMTDPAISFKYAAGDPLSTVMIANKLWSTYPYIHKIYPIDNRSTEAIRLLGQTDVLLDYDIIKRELDEQQAHLAELKQKIYSITGYTFNINSSRAKADALSRFVTLTQRTEKGEIEVSKEVLGRIDHPLAKLLLDYSKTKTYVGSFLTKMFGFKGKPVHTHYSGINTACLTESAMLYVEGQGVKSIAAVNIGDRILTRRGFKEITYKKAYEDECLKILFDNGTFLEGNGKHPVLRIIDGKEMWKGLQELQKGDEVITCDATEALNQDGDLDYFVTTFSHTLTRLNLTRCIDINFPIAFASQCICSRDETLNLYIASLKLRFYGVDNRIAFSKYDHSLLLFIHRNSLKRFKYMFSNVMSSGCLKILGECIEDSKQYEKFMLQKNCTKVLDIAKTGKKRVYDITVKDVHEFVANGIVTHNTGRLSSGASKGNDYYSCINMQNIPGVEVHRYVHEDPEVGYTCNMIEEGNVGTTKCKGGLRDAFIAPDDCYWVTADYAAEELRVAANLSGEPNMLKPLKEGKDIHMFISKGIFGYEDPGHRKNIKIVNFMTMYGGGPKALSEKLHITIEAAKELLDKYFKYLSRLTQWKKERIALARKEGIVFTYFGRPRLLLKYYQSADFGRMAFGDRTAINDPIQGEITGSSYIYTDRGLVLLKDLASTVVCDSKHKVNGYRVWNGKKFCDFGIFYHGVEDIKEITLDNGFSVEAGNQHKFKVLKDNEVVDVLRDDLKNGDEVICNEASKLDNKGVELQGVYSKYVNGSVWEVIGSSVFNKEISKKYKRYDKGFAHSINETHMDFGEYFTEWLSYNIYQKCLKNQTMNFNATLMSNMLRSLKFRCEKSSNVNLPVAVFQASLEQRCKFIDGALSTFERREQGLTYSSMSCGLLKDFQLLLNISGVQSTVRNVIGNTWEICISEKPEKLKTSKVIGIQQLRGNQKTWCICLQDESHCYVANGMLHHNCVPSSSFIEADHKVVQFDKNLAQRLVLKDRIVVPSHRGTSELYFCRFWSGDFLLCDANHQLIHNGRGGRCIEHIQDNFPYPALLSPLHSKVFPNKSFWKSASECATLLILKVNSKFEFDDRDKSIAGYFWKLAVSGRKFYTDYMCASRLRSLGTIYGFNVVCTKVLSPEEQHRHSDKVLQLQVRFHRWGSTKLRRIYFTGMQSEVATTTVISNDEQMYPSQGFWNKNTGGDVIRIDLYKFFKLWKENEEFRNNVVIVVTVHDELNFYCKKPYLYTLYKYIRQIMTIAPSNFQVPLEVEVGVGTCWGNCVDCKEITPDGKLVLE